MAPKPICSLHYISHLPLVLSCIFKKYQTCNIMKLNEVLTLCGYFCFSICRPWLWYLCLNSAVQQMAAGG